MIVVPKYQCITVIAITVLSLILAVGIFSGVWALNDSQTTNSTYYSNNFDSPSSLSDGFWSTNDTQIQNIDGTNVLEISGEASFNPQHGDYALSNFTVQFDVYHNIIYENNTAYGGPFFQLCDNQNRTIILLGYAYQEGFFTNVLTYNQYAFPFNRSLEWSTWRLTGYIKQMNEGGLYWGNFTLQVNNETITSFRSDSIIPEGIVHSITNEDVRPIAYFNVYPLPQTGVMIIPTSLTNNGIQYSLISNKVTNVAYNQAIPSFIDNFFYGYADTIPTIVTSPATTPTPLPTSTQTSTHVPTTSQPTPTPTVPEISWLILLPLVLSVFAVVILVRYRKTSKSRNVDNTTLLKKSTINKN